MSPKLVFVADDEPELASLIAETLGDEGYRVVTAPDGESLLANVAKELPDLILLDINMPGLSGWDVKARLQADARTANVPVVAVTAQGGASVEASARQTMRFRGFVRKPFKLAELLATVEDALEPQL